MGGYVLLPSRIDALAAGVLITMLLRYRYRWIAGEERWIRRAVMAFIVIWIAYEYIPNPHAIRLAFIVHTGNAIAFAGILLVVLLSPRAPLSRFLSTPAMRELGNMAYSTYLFHPILLCIAFRVIKGYDPLIKDAGDLPVVGIALLSTLILSWLSWRFFEKPLIGRGHQYQY
jgi:peptidoglycan/LPS O-acetylase OafA/YrhL